MSLVLLLSGIGASTAAHAQFAGTLVIYGVEVRFGCNLPIGSPAPPGSLFAECRSPYQISVRRPGCSNEFVVMDELVITNILVRSFVSFPLEARGDISLGGLDFTHVVHQDGTCSFGAVRTLSGTHVARVHHAGGQFEASFTDLDGVLVPARGNLVALSGGPGEGSEGQPRVEAVRARVDGTSATASARLSFGTGALGTPTNVYVFALAPRGQVGGALPAGEAACVPAQLDAVSGRLVAVSLANLRAYSSGIAAAQGQAVNILSNVPVSAVAGASFFLGHGDDPEGMLSSGQVANAVVIPGSPACSKEIAFTPGPLTGLWWNAAEAGWGIHFTQRRNVIFAAWYSYDEAGLPKWLVASRCLLPVGSRDSGVCRAPLYEVVAPRFFGLQSLFQTEVREVGSLEVAFDSPGSGRMTYSVAGHTRTVALSRQPIAAGERSSGTDFTDLWWSRRPGWGLAIAHQHTVLFLAWFVYDSAGKPTWYVASDCRLVRDECSGALYRTMGPRFGPVFDASAVAVTAVGSIRVTFSGPNTASLRYTIDGSSFDSLFITRQLF